jgi:hypothetical protein
MSLKQISLVSEFSGNTIRECSEHVDIARVWVTHRNGKKRVFPLPNEGRLDTYSGGACRAAGTVPGCSTTRGHLSVHEMLSECHHQSFMCPPPEAPGGHVDNERR